MYNVTLMGVRSTTDAVEYQSISITYSESVCLSPFLRSVNCAFAILSYVASLAVLYFCTLSHTQHDS